MYKYLAVRVAEGCTPEQHRATLARIASDPNVVGVEYLLQAAPGHKGASYVGKAMAVQPDGTVAAAAG